MIARHRIIVAFAAVAVALATCLDAAGAATDSPFPELGRSLEKLFSPPAPKKKRSIRKAARVRPAPAPSPRPIDPKPKILPVRAVPFPRERPAEMRIAARTPPSVPAPRPVPPPATVEAPPPPAALPAAPPGSSACQSRLTPDVAAIAPLPPIAGPGQCGAEDVVRLDAVMTKEGRRLALTPAAVLRCPMAEAVAHWVRDDLMPASAGLGSAPRALVVAASYDCRGRNRVADAKLSEHGHANALDLRGLTLGDGTVIDFTDKSVAKVFRDQVRQSACARFTTVLGPGSDGYHEQHVHLDLIERRGGFRMCEWDVLTLPDVAAVPLPPERPRAATGAKP